MSTGCTTWGNQVGGFGAFRHGDFHRRIQERIREAANFIRERGGEKQVLPFGRQRDQDTADVADEPHVEHAVSFVQHQEFDTGKIHGAALQMVEQAAGCCDQDVHAPAQRADLLVHADAAEYRGRLQVQVAAITTEALLDLRREFAGWREDQRANRATRRIAAGVACGQQLQQRQRESGRLASSGLRAGQNVAACEDDGNGLSLYGGGFGVAFVGNSADQLGTKAERFK